VGALPGERAPGRAGGREEPDVGNGEVALGEHLAHDAPDLPGGTDDAHSHGWHGSEGYGGTPASPNRIEPSAELGDGVQTEGRVEPLHRPLELLLTDHARRADR